MTTNIGVLSPYMVSLYNAVATSCNQSFYKSHQGGNSQLQSSCDQLQFSPVASPSEKLQLDFKTLVNKDINKAMEEYFSRPTPFANEAEGALHQETVQATCTDVEDSGMSTEGSSFLRKGVAYDGDSSRDQDYFCGKRKKKDSKPLVENQFLAFLNTLAVTVLQHLSERNGTAGASFGAAVAHHWWYGDFWVKKLDSVGDQPRWSVMVASYLSYQHVYLVYLITALVLSLPLSMAVA